MHNIIWLQTTANVPRTVKALATTNFTGKPEHEQEDNHFSGTDDPLRSQCAQIRRTHNLCDFEGLLVFEKPEGLVLLPRFH